jgi:hypothetical protein
VEFLFNENDSSNGDIVGIDNDGIVTKLVCNRKMFKQYLDDFRSDPSSWDV